MKRVTLLKIVLFALSVVLTATMAAVEDGKSHVGQEMKGKVCRMEQQCHWVNFKKICTYVKVCR